MSNRNECVCTATENTEYMKKPATKKEETVSTSHAEFNIDELTYGPLSFKGLHGFMDVVVTDENVKIQSDTISKIFGNLLSGRLMDVLDRHIDSQDKRSTARMEIEKKESEADIERKAKESEADIEYKKAQTRYYNAQAAYEEARTKRVNESEKDR